MLWCWLGVGVPALVVASVLVAVGDGFRSGADQALLFRTCAALDREDAFLEIESRTHTLEIVALVALVVFGGVLANVWGFHAAWAAETALCTVGASVAWAMREPPSHCEATEAGEDGDSVSPFLSKTLLALIVPVALLGGASSVVSFLAQTSGSGNATELTLLVALITIAEAAGAAIAPRVPAANGRGQILLGLGGAALVGAAISLPGTFHLVVVALAFLEGVAEPLRAVAIQRAAGDGVRARVASVAAAFDMLVSTIALPVAGFWAKR